jgi:hypothetical protein
MGSSFQKASNCEDRKDLKFVIIVVVVVVVVHHYRAPMCLVLSREDNR